MLLDLAPVMKATDAAVGPLLCRIFTLLEFYRQPDSLPPPTPPSAVRRVLVIRPGGIGDMVLLLPVLRRIREAWPSARIDVACERRNAAVLALTSLEVHPLVYDAQPLAFLSRLASGPHYDVAVDTEQFHHFSAIFARLSRAPVRIGFKINPRRNPLYTHLVNYAPDGHEGMQFMRLLEPLGLSAGNGSTLSQLEGLIQRPAVELPQAVVSEMRRVLDGAPYVVIHAGGRSFHKRWEDVRYVMLAGQLATMPNLGIVLVGDQREAKSSEAIAAALRTAGDKVICLAGRLALPQTAAVLAAARLFVGPDSGLAHLAVALGTPTVVLFGPSDPLKWGFENSRHAVVSRKLPCAPCFIFGYHRPCRSVRCMKEIRVEDVVACCRAILERETYSRR
ncbi:MAG: glycosyltransferase family 9 protein [Kiritimatiellia bacterium]